MIVIEIIDDKQLERSVAYLSNLTMRHAYEITDGEQLEKLIHCLCVLLTRYKDGESNGVQSSGVVLHIPGLTEPDISWIVEHEGR